METVEFLVCPDMHGRDFWRPLLQYEGNIVCLGDYTDPYPAEGFTQEDCLNNLQELIDFKKANSERVTLIIGNHDFHYFSLIYAAARFSAQHYKQFKALFVENKELFQIAKQIGNYFFTHAGVIFDWYYEQKRYFEVLGDTLEEQLNAAFYEKRHIYNEMSFYRGGKMWMSGSPIWADKNEIVNCKPLGIDIIQVVGHNRFPHERTQPIKCGKYIFTDNQKLWLFKDGEITEFTG